MFHPWKVPGKISYYTFQAKKDSQVTVSVIECHVIYSLLHLPIEMDCKCFCSGFPSWAYQRPKHFDWVQASKSFS